MTYSYDAAGRLNGVDGTGFPNVSHFASNLQYRAWGALKTESYGNGFTSIGSYNSRLQMLDFAVRRPNGATVMVDSYQYYSDGRLKFSDDDEQDLDRAYAYDHSGRLKEAYSGSEARDFLNGTQSGTATGQYRQSYQYEALGHLVQQTNRLWSETKTTLNTFADNRREGWSYDADGRLTHDDTTAYTYDAAGLLVQKAGSPGNSSSRYDGDGGMLFNHHASPYTFPLIKNVYYLPSTPLGGLALAELNLSGQKTKGNVYAGRRKLADSVDNTVRWQHQDPVTGSMGSSDGAGAYTPIAEFNADGVTLGFEDPAYSEPSVSPKLRTEWPMLAQRGGCTGIPCAQGCYVGGFELDCGMVNAWMASGAIEQCNDNNCGPRLGHDQSGNPKLVPLTTNPNTGQLGYWPNGYNNDGVTSDGIGAVILRPDGAQRPGGGSTPIYGKFGVCVGDDCDWSYEITGYSTTPSLNLTLMLQETHMQKWLRIYQSCVDDFLRGLANNRIPSSSATSDIMTVAYRESVDETLVAVTWTSESEFNSSPESNGNAKDAKGVIHQDWIKEGNVDVGPMQINYNTYHSWSGLDGLTNIFGTTTSGYKAFDGDSFANLRAGARILKDLNTRHDRAGAAGRYRAGEGDYFSTKSGQAAFTGRRDRFNSLQPKYDNFFKCIKDRR